ncbi:MAG: carboxylating nicotinate-nucleotide diphosphorylase [Nocardioidaceae bacterium]
MTRMSNDTLAAIHAAGLDLGDVHRVVMAALVEDLRYGPDITTQATVSPRATGVGVVRSRAEGVLAGLPVAMAVLDLAGDGELESVAILKDGDRLAPGDNALEVRGRMVPMLRAERTMLNLLCHLSGVATETRRWVAAVSGTGVTIRDTRKTLPGLRLLEKYAVRCGGGENHRLGLGDAALVKDNHVVAAGGVAEAVRAVQEAAPGLTLEVECDDVGQVREALDAGARTLLLDNMDIGQLRSAVRACRGYEGVVLEASGGLTLDQAAEVAATGVTHLAVGALTHSAVALDLGLDLEA